ncbi:MAG: signal peptidase I [Planctomycetota bacterium]
MTNEMSHVRKPTVAMWLSALGCGVGQIYCGRVGRGLVMYCSSLLLWPVMTILVFTGSTTVVLTGLGLLTLVMMVFSIWSARDAKAIARGMAPIEFEPQEYNRPLVYGMMIMVWFPYAIGLGLFLRSNVIEAFVVPTVSMAPSIIPGDRVLANKLGIERAAFQHGDVVVFRNPQNRKQNYIKRIVGLPGETIEIKSGQVLINDQPLPLEPRPDAESVKDEGPRPSYEVSGEARYLIYGGKAESFVDVPRQKIPASQYFLLGDHRTNSLDSREFGTIPHCDIIGQVFFNYYPGDKYQRFGRIR